MGLPTRHVPTSQRLAISATRLKLYLIQTDNLFLLIMNLFLCNKGQPFNLFFAAKTIVIHQQRTTLSVISTDASLCNIYHKQVRTPFTQLTFSISKTRM